MGTVFHKLCHPLLTLFWAIYLVATSKKGMATMELQRKLGIRSYQTAWLLLHKIRSAITSSQMFPPTGDVEVDETYVGGRRPGKRGRGAEGKSLFAAAVETDGRVMGRAYLDTVDDATTDTLKAFVTRHVAAGVTVSSDAYKAYGFDVLPKVHIVIANLKMWLRGTYNCLPSKHLQKYLDEFIFRFNRRWNLENIFDKLLVRCVGTSTFTYAELTG